MDAVDKGEDEGRLPVEVVAAAPLAAQESTSSDGAQPTPTEEAAAAAAAVSLPVEPAIPAQPAASDAASLGSINASEVGGDAAAPAAEPTVAAASGDATAASVPSAAAAAAALDVEPASMTAPDSTAAVPVDVALTGGAATLQTAEASQPTEASAQQDPTAAADSSEAAAAAAPADDAAAAPNDLVAATDAAASPPGPSAAGLLSAVSSSSNLAPSPLFSKTLQSDVGESAALTLLHDVVQSDPVFALFDEDDLERLARYLSVLSFEANDQIITKDEPASFCGVVLAGRFEAVLGDAQRVPLGKGSLVGEMAYFEGGRRTADIVAAEASVLAVISFEDLKKLHVLEAELVNKFLHMLAVVSMRKLRSMMSRAQGQTAPQATPAAPAEGAAVPAAANAASPSPAEDAPASSQETLFVARLKAESAQAKESAALAAAKTKQLIKAKRDASYRTANLEQKIKVLEQENETLREAARLAAGPAQRNKERVKLLTEQLAVMTQQKLAAEQAHVGCASAYAELSRSHEESSLHAESSRVAQETEMQSAIIAGLNETSALRQELAETNARLTSLTSTYTELCLARAALQGEHRMAQLELQSLRAQMLVLQDRVASLDKYRREFSSRLSEEELAAVNWKSKAELYLGEHTRLKARMGDLERVAEDSVRERRATLRLLAQRATLIKKLVARQFIRAVQTRRMVFELFARVHNISAARLADESSGGLSAGTGGDDSDASASLRQQRRERTRMLTSLRSARTPVIRLVLLLDEELSAFESPFRSLQAEGAQLRATLAAFFRRNIQLTSSFVAAKETYEKLHREYARLREAWSRLNKKEQERAAAAATAAAGGTDAHGQPSSSSVGQHNTRSASFDPEHSGAGVAGDDPASSPFVAPALPSAFPPLVTPAPWSPTATAAGAAAMNSLRLDGAGSSYSATLAAMTASPASAFDPPQMQGQGQGGTSSRASTPRTPRSITVVPSGSASAGSGRPQSSPRVPPSPAVRTAAGGSSAPVRPATAASAGSLSSLRSRARPLTSSAVRTPQPQGSPTGVATGAGAGAGGAPAGWVPDAPWPASPAAWAGDAGSDDMASRSQALRARILASTAGAGAGTGPRPSSSPHARGMAAWGATPLSPHHPSAPFALDEAAPGTYHHSSAVARPQFGSSATPARHPPQQHQPQQQHAHYPAAHWAPPSPLYHSQQHQHQQQHPAHQPSPHAAAPYSHGRIEEKQQHHSTPHHSTHQQQQAASFAFPPSPTTAPRAQATQQSILVRPAASPAAAHGGGGVAHSPYPPAQQHPPQAWSTAWGPQLSVSGSPQLSPSSAPQQQYDTLFAQRKQ